MIPVEGVDTAAGTFVRAGVADAEVATEFCDCSRCRREPPIARRAVHWRPSGPIRLGDVMRGVLDGRLVRTDVQSAVRRRDVLPVDAAVWTETETAELAGTVDHERRAQIQECARATLAEEQRDAERHAADERRRHREARLFKAAVTDAWAACDDGDMLWVGHQRHALHSPAEQLSPMLPLQSRHTAMGFPVWVGHEAPGRLFAVVAPWPEFTSQEVRDAWQREGVRVYE